MYFVCDINYKFINKHETYTMASRFNQNSFQF